MEENLSYYYIFYITAREKNISKAAKTLYISQPAVSKAIKKLEESTGSLLFKRSSRGVQLTYDGSILFEHVRQAFSLLEAGESELKKLQNLDTGHIRIGVSTTLCKYMLLPYLQTFTKLYPSIQISIFCQSSNHTLALLEEGKLDIGLTGKPGSSKNFSFYPLTKIQDIFVAANSYMEHFPPNAAAAALFDQAVILLLDKDNMTRHYIDDYLAENHIHPKHLLEVSTMDLLIEFAKISLGIACVIKNFIEPELEKKELVEVSLGLPIHTREIGFVLPSPTIPSHALKSFLELSCKDSFPVNGN